MFYQYPLTDAFKKRAFEYSLIISLLTLTYHVISNFIGEGLLTYFDVVIGADFLAFYTGGKFFNLGLLDKVYEFSSQIYFVEQLEFQRNLIGENFKGHHPFINPPFTAILYAPFAYFDYVTSYILWIIFNLILLGICIKLIQQELSFFQKLTFPRVYLYCFLFFPTVGCFMYAQATPIILLCYCLCFTSLRKNQDFKGGFFLGLLAIKPQLAIGIALILFFKWRWKALLGGALSVSLWLGIGFIMMPKAMLAYMTVSPELMGLLRSSDYPTWGINSIFGFSVLLFENINPRFAEWFTLFLTGTVVLLLIILWRKIKWLEDQVLWDLSMAITLCWGILISPHLFYYDLMLLLLPAAIMFQHLPWLYQRDHKILLWTTLVWATCYIGSYISLAQITLLQHFDMREICLQLSPLIIFYWGYSIYKTLHREHQHTNISTS